MSNSNDCSNEEQMLSLLTDLQTENEKLRAKTQAIEPLIEKIQQQERSLTELSAYNKFLTDENEKLLKLSENERALKSENKKLKDEKSRMEEELAQEKKHLEVLAARIAQLNQAMPTQDDIQALSKAMRGAERTAGNMSILHFVNGAVIAVFALLVVFAGWQAYNLRQDVKDASEGIQSVYNAVYNTEGWSVFEGTIMNEWIWSQNHPEAYQRYLQEKKQREQGLK